MHVHGPDAHAESIFPCRKQVAMGDITHPEPTRLFAAVMWNPEYGLQPVIDELVEAWGRIACTTGSLPFEFTDYYTREMGRGLLKQYLVFNGAFDRARLPEVKRWTNDLETRHASGTCRRVNVDPGYLSRDKLVLASTKDFYHRIYLDDGIYGEVTLHYRQGRYRHFSWTYPDFEQTAVQRVLEKARAQLVGSVRRQR